MLRTQPLNDYQNLIHVILGEVYIVQIELKKIMSSLIVWGHFQLQILHSSNKSLYRQTLEVHGFLE